MSKKDGEGKSTSQPNEQPKPSPKADGVRVINEGTKRDTSPTTNSGGPREKK